MNGFGYEGRPNAGVRASERVMEGECTSDMRICEGSRSQKFSYAASWGVEDRLYGRKCVSNLAVGKKAMNDNEKCGGNYEEGQHFCDVGEEGANRPLYSHSGEGVVLGRAAEPLVRWRSSPWCNIRHTSRCNVYRLTDRTLMTAEGGRTHLS